jgi:hypothetical protein
VRTTKVALFVALFSAAAYAEDPGPPPTPPPLETAPAEAPKGLPVPRFSKGGLTFSIEFGPGWWDWNRAHLINEISSSAVLAPTAGLMADQWINSFKTSYALSLRIGYNILGFSTVEIFFSGTGWDVPTPQVGGGGFAGGAVRVHPLEILWRILKKDPRPFGLDASMFWSWGYGIAGFEDNPNSALALGADGFAFGWGFDVEYFFNSAIGVSLGLRGNFPFWDHIYYDFNGRQGWALPNTTKGAFWMSTFGVVLRFGD